MERSKIEDCKDLKTLKKIALEQYSTLFMISEALYDNQKNGLSDEKTIKSVKHYLTELEVAYKSIVCKENEKCHIV